MVIIVNNSGYNNKMGIYSMEIVVIIPIIVNINGYMMGLYIVTYLVGGIPTPPKLWFIGDISIYWLVVSTPLKNMKVS